ncbi:MAG TPA: hypothetical protein VF796_18865 [Humisphaera sp.]
MAAVRITVEGGGVAGRAKRALSAATKAALEAAVRHWHATYLPGHFELTANRRYEYKPRKGDGEPPSVPKAYLRKDGTAGVRMVANPAYSWRKRRQKGHNRPLVWSGNLESAAKHSVRLSVRRVAAEDVVRASGTLDLVPDYFYQYRPDLDQPDKADEAFRTTEDERAALGEVFSAVLHGGLDRTAAAGPAPAAEVLAAG